MRTHLALLLPLFVVAPLSIAAQVAAQDAASRDAASRDAASQNAASPGAAPHIDFTFEHPQMQPSRYTITVNESGAGHYVSQPGAASSDDDVLPAPVDRPIQLDSALTADLFRYARGHNFFAVRCNNDHGRLAFTGNRTLAYSGPDGQGSCSFVWAADPALERLSDQLGAVALTLEIGRRLDVELRHDRLGLDAELQSLEDAAKDHRAEDLANIAGQLHAIADDQEVMNRARKRAQTLVNACEAASKRAE